MQFLNDYLRLFYSSLRKLDGTYYAPKSLICIRAAIQRHLVSPAVNRNVNIINRDDFRGCNGVLVSVIKKYLEKQPEKQVKFVPISDADMCILRNYFDRSSLRRLQDETIFNIMYHFGLRGRENLRELTPESFLIVPEERAEYVKIAVNMLSKNVKVSLSEKTSRKRECTAVKTAPSVRSRLSRRTSLNCHRSAKCSFQGCPNFPTTNDLARTPSATS